MMLIWIGACAVIIGIAAAAPTWGWCKMFVAGAQEPWNKPLFPLPPPDDDQDDEEDAQPSVPPP